MLNNKSVLITGGTGSFGKKFIAIKKNDLYLNPAETAKELYQQVERDITYYNNRLYQGIKAKPYIFCG